MKRLTITTLILCFCSSLFANPNMNLNVEEGTIYEASAHDGKEFLTIRPLPVRRIYLTEEKLSLYSNKMPIDEDTGWYIKPINSIEFKFFGTNEENAFLEGSSGLKLKKGANFFAFVDGLASFGDKAMGYYQFKTNVNDDDTKASLHRGYLKYYFGKFSLQGGKDNVNWGPGEYGVLLSSNAPPYYLVKLQTEIPLRFLGEWDFALLHGWLDEDRADVTNPKILALRLEYRPFRIFQLGLTRTTMYGGKGRPTYKIYQYPKVFWGSEENIPGGKYDNDGFVAYDLSLSLPFIPFFKDFKIYYQKAGTDVKAPWQKEDKTKLYSEFPFIFKILAPLHQVGIEASLKRDVFRIEYVDIDYRFYIHHVYHTEGYTFKDLSLGYPYGPDSKSIFFKHTHFFDNDLSIQYKIGWYKQKDRWSKNDVERYYVYLQADKKIGKFMISPYVRYDRSKNYDRDKLPTKMDIVEENKDFYIVGISTSFTF